MIAEQIHKEISQFKFSFKEQRYVKSQERKLFELGFKNHPLTNNVREEIRGDLEQKLKSELYADYLLFSVKYPSNILILGSEIEKIKDKYNLEFKSALNFIGDIPSDNLKDILSFPYDGNFDIMILGTKNQFKANIGGEIDPAVFLKLSEKIVKEVVSGEVFWESDSLYVLITMWGDEKSISEFNTKNN